MPLLAPAFGLPALPLAPAFGLPALPPGPVLTAVPAAEPAAEGGPAEAAAAAPGSVAARGMFVCIGWLAFVCLVLCFVFVCVCVCLCLGLCVSVCIRLFVRFSLFGLVCVRAFVCLCGAVVA